MHGEKPLIYIWGTGLYGELAYKSINSKNTVFLGFIETAEEKIGNTFLGNDIFPTDVLMEREFDYVFLAAKDISSMLAHCNNIGIISNKILMEDNLSSVSDYFDSDIFEKYKRTQEKLENEAATENLKYEEGFDYIRISSAEDLLLRIIKEKCSLSRFGDGEFEIMRSENRAWFQNYEEQLSKRLVEVFNERKDKHIIAIANNFNDLSVYTQDAARIIRNYLFHKREDIVQMFDRKYEYYDAYVSRPYLIYKDKKDAARIFSLWKRIWKNRNILIVEGEFVRNGMSNDLFSQAKSIRRIICPYKNCYSYYDEIYKSILLNANEDDLVLLSLGPTATVLAYDICIEGIQTIDIGQLDNEYEWYIAGVDKRSDIPGKGVPELSQSHVKASSGTDEYKEQIIYKVHA